MQFGLPTDDLIKNIKIESLASFDLSIEIQK
jgi:hypothetical protein